MNPQKKRTKDEVLKFIILVETRIKKTSRIHRIRKTRGPAGILTMDKRRKKQRPHVKRITLHTQMWRIPE